MNQGTNAVIHNNLWPTAFRLVAIAVLGLAVIFSCGTALAAEAVKTRAWQHSGYARIVFDWPKRVTFNARIDDSRLLVTFEEPMETSFALVERHLSQYVTKSGLEQGGRAASFALVGDYGLRTRRRGNSVVVDLVDKLPASSEAVVSTRPPATKAPTPLVLPAAASKVPAKTVNQNRAATRQQAGNTSDEVRVRTGQHAGYTRLVFDWTANTDYRANKSGPNVKLTFKSEARAAIDRIARRLPERIESISQRREGEGLRVDLMVPGNARMRHFRSGTKVVVDILSADGKPFQQPALQQNATQAERASIASEAVVSTRPPATKAPTPLIPSASGQTVVLSQTVQPEISAEEEEELPSTPLELPKAIQVNIEGTPEVPRIAVTPVPGIATAVFRRAGYLWLIIDTKLPTSVDDVPESLSDSLFLVEQRSHVSATVLRIRSREDLLPLWQTEPDNWALDLVSRAVPPRAPVIVQREPDSPLGARVVLAADKTGNRLTVDDPEVGDTMFVVPVASPTGVVAHRTFLQFSVQESTRGIVVTPLADDISVRLVRAGVEVTSDSGLLISNEAAGGSSLRSSLPTATEAVPAMNKGKTDSADKGAAQKSRPALQSIFRYAEWRQRAGQTFIEARDDVIDQARLTVRALRNPPRWDLAKLYFANGMSVETLGAMQLLVENDPLAVEDPVFRGIRGVARMLMKRNDEAEADLFYSSLDTDPGVHLWRGAWYVAQEKWLEAHQEFLIAGDAAYTLFPPRVRALLRIAAVEAALEQEDYESADPVLTALVTEAPTRGLKAQAMLLVARAKDALEDPKGALEAVDAAIAFDDRKGRADGNFLKAELELKYGNIKPADVVDRLEKLRFAWRGGDYELRLLNRISNLHIDEEHYASALITLREIATYFPEEEASEKAGQRMDELFRELFLNGGAGDIDPVNALALYFDFRELTPVGSDGDQMIRILADRLAAVDLLERAAELLDHQVKYRLRGEPKARVGARLAVIHLLDQKPAEAVRVLKASRGVNLPPDLGAERRHLEARALVQLGREASAIKLLERDVTRKAELIRSEIHWRRNEWLKVAASMESILGERWQAETPLDEIEQTQVLRLAVSLTFENNRAGLDTLRRRYGEKMKAGANGDAFDLLTGHVDRAATAFRDLSRQVATLDTVDAFMAAYYEAAKRPALSN